MKLLYFIFNGWEIILDYNSFQKFSHERFGWIKPLIGGRIYFSKFQLTYSNVPKTYWKQKIYFKIGSMRG